MKALERLKFALAVLIGLVIGLLCSGCTNFKATSANGDEFLYQRVFMVGSAALAEIEQYDPNGVMWLSITLNDPNSRVNNGSLKIREPKTGIEVGVTAEER